MKVNWFMLAISAALLWGLGAFVNKIAVGVFKAPSATAMLFMGVGIGASVIVYFLVKTPQLAPWLKIFGIALCVLLAAFAVCVAAFHCPELKWQGLVIAFLAGVIWTAGQVVVFIALDGGANASRLAPIYNLNTVVTVILALAFLSEGPGDFWGYARIAGAVICSVGTGLLVNF